MIPQASQLPDLRSLPLGLLPALAPARLDEMVQRVLPSAPAAPGPGARFASGI